MRTSTKFIALTGLACVVIISGTVFGMTPQPLIRVCARDGHPRTVSIVKVGPAGLALALDRNWLDCRIAFVTTERLAALVPQIDGELTDSAVNKVDPRFSASDADTLQIEYWSPQGQRKIEKTSDCLSAPSSVLAEIFQLCGARYRYTPPA